MTTPASPERLDLDAIRERADLTVAFVGDDVQLYIDRLWISSRDVPALLVEVERLRAELERVATRSQVQNLAEIHGLET